MTRRAIPVIELRPHARDPLLLEVVAAIGAGNIERGPIHDDDDHILGICDEDGRIRINEAVAVTSTTIHEAIHRMRPKWSEKQVERRTLAILATLSDQEVETIYNLVLSVSTKKTKPERLR